MLRKATLLSVAVALLATVLSVASARTLVDASRAPVQGMTQGIQTGANHVVLTLAGPHAQAYIDRIKAAWPQAQVERVADNQIRLSGAPPADLLGRLAQIDVGEPPSTATAAADDPFASLGGEAGLQIPDGSTSIRARPRANLDQPNAAAQAQAGLPANVQGTTNQGQAQVNAAGTLAPNALLAEVVSVERQQFPQAVARVRVVTAPRDSRYAGARANSEISVTAHFQGNPMNGDANRANLVINYLLPGDRVVCEIVGFAGGRYTCGTMNRVR